MTETTAPSVTPRRCVMCKKKVPLATYPCRCGSLCCALHKPDDAHNCSFDYKAQNISHLSTTMVKVVATKVESI